MKTSTARQLSELIFAFLTGAALGVVWLPFRCLCRWLPRFGILWDAGYYMLAGLTLFAAAQWCGGVRLRFLTAALLGAAVSVRLLRPLRCRRAGRKWERMEEIRRKERKPQGGGAKKR